LSRSFTLVACLSHARSQFRLQLIDVDFAGRWVLNETNKCGLQVFNILSSRQQFLKVLVKTFLRVSELLVLNLQFLDRLLRSLNLTLGMV
jgi:hypothetical protein